MWKIHGKFYDLENFLNSHPGGRTILESSKNGIDCTASFESYHAMCDKNLINSIMKKYEVDCTENKPEQLFMFKEKDFLRFLFCDKENRVSTFKPFNWILESFFCVMKFIVVKLK